MPGANVLRPFAPSLARYKIKNLLELVSKLPLNQILDFASLNKGEFPSGQRGQTVNLLATLSVVRIHLPPLFVLRMRYFV